MLSIFLYNTCMLQVLFMVCIYKYISQDKMLCKKCFIYFYVFDCKVCTLRAIKNGTNLNEMIKTRSKLF